MRYDVINDEIQDHFKIYYIAYNLTAYVQKLLCQSSMFLIPT
mgnify:CR=1 FL=1